jgi:hypothetical protein
LTIPGFRGFEGWKAAILIVDFWVFVIAPGAETLTALLRRVRESFTARADDLSLIPVMRTDVTLRSPEKIIVIVGIKCSNCLFEIDDCNGRNIGNMSLDHTNICVRIVKTKWRVLRNLVTKSTDAV